MLEVLALAYQMHRLPSFDSQAAVYNALSSPKVVSVSGSPEPLEGRLEAQARSARTIPLNQVKEILSKTYIDPKTDFRAAYIDLASRGRAINYALDNFPYEEIRELPIYEYFSKIREFQSLYRHLLFQNLGDIMTFLITGKTNAVTEITNQRASRTELIGQMSEVLEGIRTEVSEKRHQRAMENLERIYQDIIRTSQQINDSLH